MRRTAIVFALVLASVAAAAVAAIRLQRKPAASATAAPQPLPQPLPRSSSLSITTRLDRRWLDSRGGESYLEIGVAAAGDPERGPRTAVNAVLVIDRSGSMSGAKIERARDAARAFLEQLDPEDRLAIVDFASDARVLVPSAPATAGFKERASALIARLQATTGTNLSAALDLAAPQLAQGKGAGRLDKVFLASDGLANEGVVDRIALLALARRDFGEATVSTFGIGDDYDEDLMTALAAQAGGRTRFIRTADELPPAVRAELTRASRAVAREVRLDVRAVGGAKIVRVLGYPSEGGWIRLPDFAAGEERRVLVKLALPAASAGTVEVARVALSFADAQGTAHRDEAAAQAAFTADRSLLGLPPTDALAHGVRAEMAELAQSAAELKGAGRADEAREKMVRMRQVVHRAARMAPAKVAGELQDEESAYDTGVQSISGANDAPSKAVKQKSFDAVRAPVAGW